MAIIFHSFLKMLMIHFGISLVSVEKKQKLTLTVLSAKITRGKSRSAE
jgi:hypothetical protein